MTVVDPAAHAIDPLAHAADGDYVDESVRVVRADDKRAPAEPGELIARTEHFRLYRTGSGIRLSHPFQPEELDNDLTGLLVDELFRPGWLVGNDIFERVFVGIVRTAAPDPLAAWHTFYANTLSGIRRAWTGGDMRAPHSTIAETAVLYDRALQLVGPGRVLDVGSCFGFFPLLLAARTGNSVLASDLAGGSMRLLSAIARRTRMPLRTLECDATSVPLPAGCVDTVTVLHLLEHLDPARGAAVLSEAVRLATGTVVVGVPFEDEVSECFGHVRRFDRATLTEVGDAAGKPFTVSEHHGGWLVVDAG